MGTLNLSRFANQTLLICFAVHECITAVALHDLDLIGVRRRALRIEALSTET
jgi:hypothetical protein